MVSPSADIRRLPSSGIVRQYGGDNVGRSAVTSSIGADAVAVHRRYRCRRWVFRRSCGCCRLVVDGGDVAIIAGIAYLAWYCRVVVIAVHIGADAVAVVVADTGAGGGRPAQLQLRRLVVEGGDVAIVAGVAYLVRDIRVVVIAIDIGADTVAVVIADAGAAVGASGAVAVVVELVVDGGDVAIVAGIAWLVCDIGVVVVNPHRRRIPSPSLSPIPVRAVGVGAVAVASSWSLTVVMSPSSRASPGWSVILGSLSSRSTSAQTPSPSHRRCRCRSVGVPAQLQLLSSWSLTVVIVAIVAGVAGLAGIIRVVVVAIHHRNAVAVVVADTGAGGGRSGAVAVGCRLVVEGGDVAIVTGVAWLICDVGVVVVTIHIGADTVAVVVAETGAGGGRAGAVAVAVDLVVEGGDLSPSFWRRHLICDVGSLSSQSTSAQYRRRRCRRCRCGAVGVPVRLRVGVDLVVEGWCCRHRCRRRP